MKKNSLIFIVMMLLNGGEVFGQSVFYFQDSNSVWSVWDKKYFAMGDSTISTKQYKKYYVSADSVINYSAITFFALFREDSLTRKIFVIQKDSINEKLIYDFSLTLGDTATVTPIAFDSSPYPVRIKINQVDSILINSQYRKRYKAEGVDFNMWPSEYWIEGIGSNYGPFNSGLTGAAIVDVQIPLLLCYEESGQLFYNNPGSTTCYAHYPTTGIGEIKGDNYQLHVYPNPTQSQIILEFDLTETINGFIEIKNILGQTVKTIENSPFSNGKNKIEIDFSEISKGLYFVNLQSENKFMSKKFIKE